MIYIRVRSWMLNLLTFEPRELLELLKLFLLCTTYKITHG